MILVWYFNVNFAKDELVTLITFLQQECQLQIYNSMKEFTIKYETTIYAVFKKSHSNIRNNVINVMCYHSSTIRGSMEYYCY